ncbi:MAG TPA: hypothetical protein VHJ20_16155 [Polyangia bacterium]|nr:hypothetical protein [Polyangia bacterium]
MTLARVGLGLVVMAALVAPARAEAPDLEGRWIAKAADGRVLAGWWSATVDPKTPDVALGTWKAYDTAGHVVSEGTWSARKAAKQWRGAWAARVLGGGDANGTWTADDATVAGAKTFADMLMLGTKREIGGTWRAGHTRGRWWFKPRP